MQLLVMFKADVYKKHNKKIYNFGFIITIFRNNQKKLCHMKYNNIKISTVGSESASLPDDIELLVDKARLATGNSYSPYSQFCVGAALLLENGEIITGSNQENAAYPSGLCAERVALFYANSQYPNVAIKHLVIAAKGAEGFVETPISPCGACRQVMLEVEARQSVPMTVWLVGESAIYSIPEATNLLPFAFVPDSLAGK